MCRTQIMRDLPEDDDDESEGEYEDRDDDQEEDQEEDEEQDQKTPTLEQFAAKLQNMGYTMADVLGIFYDAKPEDSNKRYNPEFWQKMDQDIGGILEGTIPLSSRDTRSYADVVKTQLQVQPQQQSIQ